MLLGLRPLASGQGRGKTADKEHDYPGVRCFLHAVRPAGAGRLRNAVHGLGRLFPLAAVCAKNDGFGGKITLPVEHEGEPIRIIGGFGGTNITHVFFKGTPQVKILSMGCFRNCNNLVYFQYPDTITELMDYSLADTPSLEPIRLNKGLVYIRNFALNGAFNRAKDYDLFIPGSVTTIENNGLSMISAHLNSITFGGPGDANHLSNIDNVQFIGQNSYNHHKSMVHHYHNVEFP